MFAAWVRRTPVWLRLVVVLAVPAAVFGLYVRFAGVQDVFCGSPDEFGELMPGLRLHGLPLFNLRAPLRYNFIQSMFYSHHGLGDVSFSYLASGALSLLRLPVSERFLFNASAVTNLALIVAGWTLAARVLDNRGAAWVFAILMLVSPYFVFVSKTAWGRLNWTPLLLVLVFLFEWRALTRRGAVWSAAFVLLAGFVSLTDGFVVLPIVPVLGILLMDGRFGDRVRRLVRDPAFLTACAAIAAGITLEVLIGLGARRRGTDLSLMAYVMHLSAGTRLVPTAAILNVWAHCVDYYLPFRGAWLLVSAACVFAAIEGLRGRVVGFVAAWWALTSLGVLRYAATLSEWPDHPVPGWLNASQLALPSLLLVAWVIASIADGRLPVLRRLGARTRAGCALAVLVILLTLMMRQAYATLQRDEDELVRFVSPPLSACRALKAAAFYVRSHDGALPYVFQLSSDVYLGHIGEFYYGLSYGRSSRPEDPNHLLDFGLHAYGRKYPPQAFYRAYEVPRFEYYVDFTADHVADEDGFKASVVSRLLGEGAHVVCTITDAGRPIGRILSFRDEGPVQLDARAASKSWDRQFGHARTLLLQPLAGTAYHFGYNWRKLE